jgi:hypothetical protein
MLKHAWSPLTPVRSSLITVAVSIYQIEVVDTLFTEELVREVLSGKARDLEITMKPWWWWASYRVA